jgi:Leucine-rich repeat (LRR) protein
MQNNLGDEGIVLLVDSSNLFHLTSLDLSTNKIGDKGAIAIATSPYLSSLKKLDLFNNQITLKGLKAILQSKTLVSLQEIDFVKNNIDDESAAKLWESHMNSCRALKTSDHPNKKKLPLCVN